MSRKDVLKVAKKEKRRKEKQLLKNKENKDKTKTKKHSRIEIENKVAADNKKHIDNEDDKKKKKKELKKIKKEAKEELKACMKKILEDEAAKKEKEKSSKVEAKAKTAKEESGRKQKEKEKTELDRKRKRKLEKRIAKAAKIEDKLEIKSAAPVSNHVPMQMNAHESLSSAAVLKPAQVKTAAALYVPVPVCKPAVDRTAGKVVEYKWLHTNSHVTLAPNSKSPTAIRAPVAIRKPGSNREINPIYSSPLPVRAAPSANDFVIPGLNDTEESKLLTRTFADKWYLPANLYRVEAQTGLKYRRGQFSPAEQILAERVTTKYCQDNNMTLETFKTVFFDEMSHSNTKRLSDFFVSASQYFGGRPVVAVYDFLKRKYHPGNYRGFWNSEDDQILLREFQKHGPKWTLIGKELNRQPTNCRDRYNLRWKHVDRVIYGPWSPADDKKLLDAIDASLKNSGTISWIWVSEEGVGNRTPLQCLVRWKHFKELGDRPERKLKTTWNGWKADEDYFLIHSLETESGVNSDDLVDWKSLKIKRIPKIRHNPELFFRRWNHLKSRAEIGKVENEDFKGQLEKVKKYLIGLSKSPAYIFSEAEEEEI